MCYAWIEEFVNTMFKEQSFNYSSFDSAKDKIVHEGLDRYIEYDRITLSVYNHNLETDECERFFNYMKNCKNFNGHNDTKLREEYKTLLNFFRTYNKDFLKEKIKKEERPDFVLQIKSKKIGIEITKLLLNNEGLINSIVKNPNVRKKNKEETITYVREKYGQRTTDFEFLQTENVLGIGPKRFSNLTTEREEFALQIMNKHNKYKEESKHYEELIILCDATEGIAITKSWEADEVLDKIKCDRENENIHTFILYQNDKNALEYRKK